ncbi:MAG: hypothetical protein DRQ47_10950, partial [Gammaproteobacteria bacterium]
PATSTEDPVGDTTGTWMLAGQSSHLLLNSKFNINQRAVSGSVVLGSGVYGHDRWKAGSGGCSYTFAKALGITTLTISAGTLVQEIDGDNIISGNHVLSWAGTAQAQVDGGGYGDTGEVVETLIGGTNAVIEFGTGTVTKTQLDPGISSTLYKNLMYQSDLDACKLYFERIFCDNTNRIGSGYAHSTTSFYSMIRYTEKRIDPSVTYSGVTDFRVITFAGGIQTTVAITIDKIGLRTAFLNCGSLTGMTAGEGGQIGGNVGIKYFDADSEI